jgi:thioredoxin 1
MPDQVRHDGGWLFSCQVNNMDDEKGKLRCMKRIQRTNSKLLKLFLVVLLTSLLSGMTCNAESHIDLNQLPVKGMVTMIDLGAKKCIPCKMMAPILEKMKKQYEGKAAIVFIDVWENKEQASKYGVRAIPTQIFYDQNGKETHRHVGFLSEKAIVGILQSMGVK